jgi:dipeptidyl aminopeptidase/acylaminoacyl peptidase
VSDDTNGKGDIFVRDMHTGITTRVSIASDGTQGNDKSDEPSVSGDGRYVAFWSYASNLVPGDTNNRADVFVYDRDTGLITRVSIASDGTQANGHSFNSISISADGDYVALMSYADNLVPGDTNNAMDVFVHDLKTGLTTRVSVASDGTQSNADAFITRSSISGDGRYITFMSGASNLVLPDTNNLGDVFVHDRETGITSRVSVSSDGAQGNSGNDSALISKDGRYVVFWSLSNNLVPNDTNNIEDIFVHDRETGATSRVSVSSNGTQSNSNKYENNSSVPWSISDDGRYVAFTSEVSNLVPGDTNDVMDVFVRDLNAGVTTRVSVASDGTQSNNPSYVCSISGDGKYVVFKSWANNLVPSYENSLQEDIFLHENKNGN